MTVSRVSTPVRCWLRPVAPSASTAAKSASAVRNQGGSSGLPAAGCHARPTMPSPTNTAAASRRPAHTRASSWPPFVDGGGSARARAGRFTRDLLDDPDVGGGERDGEERVVALLPARLLQALVGAEE